MVRPETRTNALMCVWTGRLQLWMLISLSLDQSFMVSSRVSSAEGTASASSGPGQGLGEVCCRHMREEEWSHLLPPMEVPSSLCQSPRFPGYYLKEIMVLILSKPQLPWVCPSSEKGICTKGRLPGGKQKWLLVIMHSLSQKGTAHLCLSSPYLSTTKTWSFSRCCFPWRKLLGNETASGNAGNGIG